jgi:hypothetical protein
MTQYRWVTAEEQLQYAIDHIVILDCDSRPPQCRAFRPMVVRDAP